MTAAQPNPDIVFQISNVCNTISRTDLRRKSKYPVPTAYTRIRHFNAHTNSVQAYIFLFFVGFFATKSGGSGDLLTTRRAKSEMRQARFSEAVPGKMQSRPQ
jgi:hypothetical protein